MKGIVVTLLVGLAGLAFAVGQAPGPDEEKAVRTAVESYTAAFNKGDLDGLLSHVAADADFVNDSGKDYKGKASLAELLKQSLADFKGRNLKTSITELHFVRPDVVILDGKADIADADGATGSGRFTAVWTKTGGKWLLSSLHDLPDSPAVAESDSAPLKQLEWLVGEWAHKDRDYDVRVRGHWTLDNSFLVLEYSVKGKDKDDLTVVQFFAWDPTEEVIRSWFFDSKAGFGGGQWARTANTWTADWSGVLSAGQVASSVNSIRFIDDKSFLFRSVDREIDGLPLADVEVKFVRQAATK
jgi:uncharacterized protein (TIGR02246 family)